MNTRGDCFRLLLIAWSVLSLLDCHMSVWLLVVQYRSEDWWSSCCELKVSVKFGQSFDRIPHPDAALEESISEVMGSIYTLSLNCMSILCMLACIHGHPIILCVCWSFRYGTKGFSRTHLYITVQSFGYASLALSWYALFAASLMEMLPFSDKAHRIKLRKQKVISMLSDLHALYK